MDAEILELAMRPEGVSLDELAELFGPDAFDIIDMMEAEDKVFLDDREGIVYATGSSPSPNAQTIMSDYVNENRRSTMKLTKNQLRRIIRETMDESEIYPRPQHPMIANAGKEMDSARIESIADELMIYMDLQDEPELVREVAEAILNRLKDDGLC